MPAPFVAEAPPQDQTALDQINQQVQAADVVEKEVTAPGTAPAATPASVSFAAVPAGPPPETSIGQTIEEVVANNGQPLKILNGAAGKKIYVYKEMKITFVAGKATAIE